MIRAEPLPAFDSIRMERAPQLPHVYTATRCPAPPQTLDDVLPGIREAATWSAWIVVIVEVAMIGAAMLVGYKLGLRH